MSELGIKFLGKNQEGLAQAIEISKHSGLNVANNTKVLFEESFTCVNAGFHLWGKTVGRGHNVMHDISDINSLSVEITQTSTVSPSRMDLLLFTCNNRFTTGNNPRLDPDCMKVVPIDFTKTNGKYTLSSEAIGDVSHYIGMAIIVDMPVDCAVTVKVLGSSSCIKKEEFVLLCDKELTFTSKNEMKRIFVKLHTMAKRLKALVYKKGTFDVQVAYIEGFEGNIYGNSYWNGTSWDSTETTKTILPTQANVEEKVYHLNSAITELENPVEHAEFRFTSLGTPSDDNILKIKIWGEF